MTSANRLQRGPRGQAAAMMAATMMLIALMVCVTLGVGMKVREKAEAQTLADLSAYSGAVMTARTFNAIAILNRAEVAEMVSGIATQSLVSYASYYRAMLLTTRAKFQRERSLLACLDTCGRCDRYQALIDAANAELARIDQEWARYDGDGHRRIEDIIGAARGIYLHQQYLYDDLINEQLVGTGLPPLANAIAQRGGQGSDWFGELTAPDTVNVVNQREVGRAVNCDPGAPQAICYDSGPTEIPIKAAMGSVWYQVERDATNLVDILQNTLVAKAGLNRGNGEDALVANFQGSSRYQSNGLDHGLPGGMGLIGEALEGELRFTIYTAACGALTLPPVQMGSAVYSTSVLNGNDYHVFNWVDGNGAAVSNGDPQGPNVHALNIRCQPPDPVPCGLWPGFVDLNPGHLSPGVSETHLYGQPKITSVVERNYAARPTRADPWNLLYTINIGQSSSEVFDNKGIQTATGVDISRQTAIATGLAYYHRRDHWREPPNFFNPYWRATLVSGAIDLDGNPSRGGRDMQESVRNAQFAQDVIDQLAQQGFRGWQ